MKLDLTAEKDGFVADTAVTVGVGELSQTSAALSRCAEQAFFEATAVARAGNRVRTLVAP